MSDFHAGKANVDDKHYLWHQSETRFADSKVADIRNVVEGEPPNGSGTYAIYAVSKWVIFSNWVLTI